MNTNYFFFYEYDPKIFVVSEIIINIYSNYFR